MQRLQVLDCFWDNGVCEAWKAMNSEIMGRRALLRVKKEEEVVVID